jgi:hypothetical protein
VMNPKPLASLNHFTLPVVRIAWLLNDLVRVLPGRYLSARSP